MGVWIEIYKRQAKRLPCRVAPFVGVWIEICKGWHTGTDPYTVAPFVGVWIEIKHQ